MSQQLYFPEVSSDEDVIYHINQIESLVTEAELQRRQSIAVSQRVGVYCLERKRKMGADMFETLIESAFANISRDKLSLCMRVADKFSEDDVQQLGSKEIGRLLQTSMKSVVDQAERIKPPFSVLNLAKPLDTFCTGLKRFGGVSALSESQRLEAQVVLKPIKQLIDKIYAS